MRAHAGGLWRRLTVPAVLVVALVALLPGLARAAPPPAIHLNQMQVIGSHNSFHIEPTPDQIAAYSAFDPDAILLAYSHPPLDQQFKSEGVRQIELDIYADPNGDLWRPMGTKGFKVFHINIIDEGSTCLTLLDCLHVVKAWSDAHPAHMPIAIQLEIHDNADIPVPPLAIPVTGPLYDDLDAEIRSVFPPERLITPDDVRGSHTTLEEAILSDGWPVIDNVRGRVMFTLDNEDKTADYIQGHPSLQGRPIFAPSQPGHPEAAFIKMNDPTGANQALITSRVQAGYLIRTRADDPVTTAKSGDTTQRDAALASGAQWVSTDYPIPGLSTRWGTNYVAQIPGGTPARCNPVNAPTGCTNTAIENLPPDPVITTTTTTAAPTSTVVVAAVPVSVTPRFTG